MVEDEPVVRGLTEDALAGLGQRVPGAERGEASLRLLDARPEVALLFTDIVCPGPTSASSPTSRCGGRPDLRALFTMGSTRSAVVH